MQNYIVDVETAAFYDLHFRLPSLGAFEDGALAMRRAKATYGFEFPELPEEASSCGFSLSSEEGPELVGGVWHGTMTMKVVVGATFRVEASGTEDAMETGREAFSWPMSAGDWVLDGTDYIKADRPEPVQEPAPSFKR